MLKRTFCQRPFWETIVVKNLHFSNDRFGNGHYGISPSTCSLFNTHSIHYTRRLRARVVGHQAVCLIVVTIVTAAPSVDTVHIDSSLLILRETSVKQERLTLIVTSHTRLMRGFKVVFLSCALLYFDRNKLTGNAVFLVY